jgi:accessory gene regulator protein AgrB
MLHRVRVKAYCFGVELGVGVILSYVDKILVILSVLSFLASILLALIWHLFFQRLFLVRGFDSHYRR